MVRASLRVCFSFYFCYRVVAFREYFVDALVVGMRMYASSVVDVRGLKQAIEICIFFVNSTLFQAIDLSLSM